MSHVVWATHSPSPKYRNLHQYDNFLEILDDHDLSQIVADQKRGENLLDLFCTSIPTLINDAKVIQGTFPCISDHRGVLVESDIKPNQIF